MKRFTYRAWLKDAKEDAADLTIMLNEDPDPSGDSPIQGKTEHIQYP